MVRSVASLLIVATLSSPLALADDLSTKELKIIVDERDHRYSQRFDSQEKAVASALAAAKEAVSKAENATEKRFDSVNEFRNTLKDQQGTYVTRSEALGAVVGLGGLILAMLTLFLKRGY